MHNPKFIWFAIVIPDGRVTGPFKGEWDENNQRFWNYDTIRGCQKVGITHKTLTAANVGPGSSRIGNRIITYGSPDMNDVNNFIKGAKAARFLLENV